MTNRERLLTILAGGSPDRVPWIPRLELWYGAHKLAGTLPTEYRDQSLREIERGLGMGTPAREARIFRTEIRDVEMRTKQQGNEIITEYITPVGTVSTVYRDSNELRRAGIRGRELEHVLKGPEDYVAVEYLIQHTEIIPTFDDYRAYEEEIGEDGVPMVNIGQDPMSLFLQEIVGYNQAYFHLNDYPERVHHLLGVLGEQAERILQVTLDSPAKLVLTGQHFDSQFTPPHIFREYMVPYYRACAGRLHERGKALACHADADTSLLLDLIVEAGFDMAECFVTAPMVRVTMEQARAAFGSRVIIWGGIPSVLLCDPVTDEEFETFMDHLLRTIAPGDAFVLGVADNVMPEAKIERVERVSEMVREYGEYPMGTSV
jgi:uroporphyrinogen-III decarboxylase